MIINCGIIGLPNVGKSVLFQAITNLEVKIANFPFSTIRPNVATIHIFDPRLYQLSNLIQSKKIIYDSIEFIDIAGLIKGASQGIGLGNQILQHIRTVKILCHVVRCFDSNHISHISGNVDPTNDINIVNTELILFDILQCEENITNLRKKQKIFDKNVTQKLLILEKCLLNLYNNIDLRSVKFSNIEKIYVQKLNFLTFKPIIYVANVNEKNKNDIYLHRLYETITDKKIPVIICCAVALLNKNISNKLVKQHQYNTCINELKIFSSQSKKDIIQIITNNIFSILHLCTFFTINSNISRSWTNPIGITALESANKIHSDFKNGFIRVQVIKFDDFIVYKGETGSKKSGKVRYEGKNYQVADGDVLKFLFHSTKRMK